MSDVLDFEELVLASRQAVLDGRHAHGAFLAQQALSLRTDGEALALLALHQLRLGDLRACLAACQEAAPLLQAPEQAGALAGLEGTQTVACLQGEFVEQGLVHAQRAVAAAELSGDPRDKAWATARLAQVHLVLGDRPSIERLYDQAWSDALALGDTGLQFSILHNRAWHTVDALLRGAAMPAQQIEAALDLLRRTQALAQADGNAHGLSLSLLNQARCLQSLARSPESRALAEQALRIGQDNGLTQMQVGAHAVLTGWMLLDGQAAQALAVLQTVRQSLSNADRIGQVDLLRLIVRAHRQLGQFEAALDAYDELHAMALDQAKARADLRTWLALHQQSVERERVRAQQAETEAELQRLRAAQWESEAQHDALTGLANRRYVNARLPTLLEHARQTQGPLFAAMLDLDHFKRINDRFGHPVGDEVLRALGRLLQEQVRPRDLPARLGGEEFLVLLPDTTQEQALAVCERLRLRVQQHPWQDVAPGLVVTTSIGLAPIGEPHAPWQAVDGALYRAKSGGRNAVVLG